MALRMSRRQLSSVSDYLDLYLIHSPPSGTDLRIETYKALVDAKKAGKLRDIGVSN
jgi:diketogulonate reductase-like aldo/keto reductase